MDAALANATTLVRALIVKQLLLACQRKSTQQILSSTNMRANVFVVLEYCVTFTVHMELSCWLKDALSANALIHARM